ncbi:avidin/streptavidin family protein [Shewanella sp.]|uniref:avidin/streptavidin family protein n=1 Tax=Shewanella sp. TaxID=50422 RepID=UPI0040543D94
MNTSLFSSLVILLNKAKAAILAFYQFKTLFNYLKSAFNYLKISALLICLCGVSGTLMAQELTAMSAWVNQDGSTLYINSINAQGELTGSYINRAAGFACQNSPYPVNGWVFGTAISFSTKWLNSVESCNSITSWSGFYNNAGGQGKISTLWQLVVNGSSSPSQILKGQDVFSQTSAIENKSLSLKP